MIVQRSWLQKIVMFALVFVPIPPEASSGFGMEIGTAISADEKPQRKKYEPTWESLDGVPVPKWFDDAKFGIFIHWGGYSVLGYKPGGRGYAEHSPKGIYREPTQYYPVIKERFGAHPPEFGYKDMLARFKAEKWDPDAWARLFDDAGAKYVVLTAEHHDGYALWDSDLTDWCATKVGPMRDLVGDLGVAVRKLGMKYAPSYHRERHPGFFAKDIYAINSEPQPDIAEEIKRMPSAEGLYGPFSYTDEFIADYVARWKEIQDKYQPDFMWIDDIPVFYKDGCKGHPQALKFQQACAGMIADYLNKAPQWGKQLYLNNKGGQPNWPVDCGCREKDNLKLASIGPKWQSPATLGTSYGYMKDEEQRDVYKSPTQLIHLLCDVVSKNGNLLLNIGPRADGTIPDGMKRRLLAMGEWLNINGEAIYGTHYWKAFGQNTPALRFTVNPKVLYAIALDKPIADFTIESTKGFGAGEVESVTLLGSKAKVGWLLTDGGLQITPPKNITSEHAWVFKIRTRKALK